LFAAAPAGAMQVVLLENHATAVALGDVVIILDWHDQTHMNNPLQHLLLSAR
jgi:hypothetical protein